MGPVQTVSSAPKLHTSFIWEIWPSSNAFILPYPHLLQGDTIALCLGGVLARRLKSPHRLPHWEVVSLPPQTSHCLPLAHRLPLTAVRWAWGRSVQLPHQQTPSAGELCGNLDLPNCPLGIPPYLAGRAALPTVKGKNLLFPTHCSPHRLRTPQEDSVLCRHRRGGDQPGKLPLSKPWGRWWAPFWSIS